MTKCKELCNRLVKEKKINLYDTLDYKYPGSRIKTLDTGKGHPVIYRTKLATTVTRNGAGAVVVYEDL